MRKAAMGALALAFALAAGAAYAGDAPEIGKVIPDQSLKTIDGKTAKLADYRNDEKGEGGKVVVITFWSYKCPSGKRMMQDNRELAEFCEKKDVVFLGISSYGEKEEDVKKYCDEKEIEYPIVYDSDLSIAKAFAASVVTTTVVLDKDGKLAYYGSLTSRKKDPKTGEKALHARNAVEELIAGKKVSKSKGDLFG